MNFPEHRAKGQKGGVGKNKSGCGQSCRARAEDAGGETVQERLAGVFPVSDRLGAHPEDP